MVGTNVKQETLTLMDKRTSIEAEIEGIITRLSAADGPGLTGSLVDKDGFPRADLDIPAVRADRQRVSVLRNDHKEISSKIEQNLHVLHSGSLMRDLSVPQRRTANSQDIRPQRTAAAAIGTSTAVALDEAVNMEVDEDVSLHIPFATFDEVAPGSPAEHDGIKLGDQLVKFGTIQGGDNLLSRLASEGQRNQGTPVEIVVLRNGVKLDLTIIPRMWSGRGLMGCHIRPLTSRT